MPDHRRGLVCWARAHGALFLSRVMLCDKGMCCGNVPGLTGLLCL